MPNRALRRPAIILGAGLMGRWHADAARRAGADIKAIVDPDAARALALARRFPGADVATRLDAVPEWADAVAHITAPTSTHAALAEACLGRGWHVLVEKPVAVDAPTTAAILDSARAHGRLLCPVHQFLYQRGVQTVLAGQDALGDLVHVRVTIASAGAVHRPDEADAVAFEILPHPFSLIARLLPGALDRVRWHPVRPGPGDLGLVGTVDQVALSVFLSMRARPTVNELSIAGTRATAFVDLFHGFSVRESGDVSRRRKMVRPFGRAATTLASAGANLARRAATGQAAYPGLWELVEAFYQAVRSGRPSPISADETLAVARAGDTIRAALAR